MSEVAYSGWMRKSPPELTGGTLQRFKKRVFKPKWTRRYFVLSKQNEPHVLPVYTLQYYENERCTRLCGAIDLDQCTEITESQECSGFKNVLAVATMHKGSERTYQLAAETEEQMNNWVLHLCRACSLVPEQPEDTEMPVTRTLTRDDTIDSSAAPQQISATMDDDSKHCTSSEPSTTNTTQMYMDGSTDEERKKIFGNSNASTIESYVKALNEGTEKSSSIRIMVVGHYGAGKTTVTRKLLGIPVEGIQSTDGIDINIQSCLVSEDGIWHRKQDEQDIETSYMERLASVALHMEGTAHSSQACCYTKHGTIKPKKHPSIKYIKAYKRLKTTNVPLDGNEKTINVWDFGGQLIYYATHQLFHSSDAIYLLVLNLSLELDHVVTDDDSHYLPTSKDVASFCKFWVHSIHSFVGTASSTPPIILIGTHMDMLPGDERQRREFADKYFIAIRDLFSDTPLVLQHIQQNEFLMAKTTTEETLKDLRNTIVNLANTNARETPAKWIALENSLLKLRHKKHVTFNEVVNIGAEHNIHDKDDIVSFLAYHSSQGKLFYFDEPVLSDHVVLDPQWIIDALKCIITSERFCKKRHTLYGLWNDLMMKAILRSTLIEDVWKNDDTNDFIDHKDTLLQFMIKFGIIAKAKQFDEETETCEELDFFIVPSLLQNRSSDKDVCDFMRDRQATSTTLVFSFQNESVSSTLYHRTTAAALAMWPLVKYKNKHMLYEHVGIYKLDIKHAGIIEVTVRTIEICVVNLCRENVDNRQAGKLRRFLEMVLKHEFGRFQSRVDKYKIGIRCNVEENNSQDVTLMDDIKGLKVIPCPDLTHGHEIDVHMVKKEWFPQQSIDKCYGTNLCEKIPEKDLKRIAETIGNNWELLAASLGIPDVTCDHIKMDHKYSSVLQIFKMLLKWSQEKNMDATYAALLREIEETPEVKVDKDQLRNIFDNFEW